MGEAPHILQPAGNGHKETITLAHVRKARKDLSSTKLLTPVEMRNVAIVVTYIDHLEHKLRQQSEDLAKQEQSALFPMKVLAALIRETEDHVLTLPIGAIERVPKSVSIRTQTHDKEGVLTVRMLSDEELEKFTAMNEDDRKKFLTESAIKERAPENPTSLRYKM